MKNKISSIEEYIEERKKIQSENENLVGVVLNEQEKKADLVLSNLKKELNNDFDNNIPYSMPMISDHRLRNSKLYSVLRKLPKGSDLHVHGTGLVPIEKLIDFILKEDRLLIDVNTCILTYEKNKDTYTLKEALDLGLITKEQLLEKWTIIGKKRKANAWEYFENIFVYHEAIDEDLDVLYNYYLFAFEYYISINIYHVEIHVLLSKDLEKTNAIINTIKKAYFEVKNKHKELIVSLIGASMKMFETIEETKQIIDCVLDAHKNIKDDYDSNNIHDFVLGIDLINEEDKSRPLQEYASLLLEVKKANPNFEYYLHCGESINARNDNLIDAYLLGATRVGHGTNLYRYPNLLKSYADNEICLESCLISNQSLGYVYDLRLHPSAEYLKRGVTIALCSDDPMYMENDTLVDDFFAAVVSWDLGIAEIKHLCINSIMYSGIDQNLKKELMENWHIAWKKFIADIR